MAGLSISEMLVRRLLRRVLIIPPAGLVGNWERELRTLFGLDFRIVVGAEAKSGNPFTGSSRDLVIMPEPNKPRLIEVAFPLKQGGRRPALGERKQPRHGLVAQGDRESLWRERYPACSTVRRLIPGYCASKALMVNWSCKPKAGVRIGKTAIFSPWQMGRYHEHCGSD
jgi:hypothetical protein